MINKLEGVLTRNSSPEEQPKEKKIKILDDKSETPEVPAVVRSPIWVKFGKQLKLAKCHRESGKRLTDLHINFIQEIIKNQFQLTELQSTLLQHSQKIPSCSLQIIFCRSNYWIAVSTIKATKEGTVIVYDSLYDELDDSTKKTVQFLFSDKIIEVVPVQKQFGYNDCGLFVIANAVQLAKGLNPSNIHFSQHLMRSHLIKCCEEIKMSSFPTL